MADTIVATSEEDVNAVRVELRDFSLRIHEQGVVVDYEVLICANAVVDSWDGYFL